MFRLLFLAATVSSSFVYAAPTILQSYKTWTSVGCYEDSMTARVLPYPQAIRGGSSAVTVERCLDACYAAGYTVAGLEWSQECFCGHKVPSKPATDGRCNMPCKGNSQEICGGRNGVNVYKNNGPTNLQGYNGWSYTDCYVDSVRSRVLPEQKYVSGPMTIEKCLDTCNVAGFDYAGLEYSKECFCGKSAPATVATDGRCNMACKGNLDQICGGGSGLSVYHRRPPTNLQPYKSWTFSNCYVDSVHQRVLPKQLTLRGGGMTVEWCLDGCAAAGYSFAGVEYGKECFCGRSSPTNVATDGRCRMSCEGNAGELCGGPNGISVYKSSDPGQTPHNLETYDKWAYSGCFVDSVHHRVLPVRAAIESNPAMTIELCLNACKYLKYSFAGLENANECWCGNSLPPKRATDDRCNKSCKGNPLELCGGPDGISVYEYCEPTPTTITTTTRVVTVFTTARTIATAYTDTFVSGGYVVGTTTIVAPATITTTIAVPITATTTVIGNVVFTTSLATALTGSTVITVPVTVPITVATPIPASSTVPVALTGSTIFTIPVTGSTTVVVPLTASATVPVTLTGPTTVPVPLTAASTVIVPTTFISTALVPSTGTRTVPITVGRTSFTLSVFTGTTSFVDPFTTVIQPVIILTTLARTFTTTTGSPVPFTTLLPVTTFIPTSVATDFPVTVTTLITTPFVFTSDTIQVIPTSSLDIEPVVSTAESVLLIPTTSFDIETFTATTVVTDVITTPTSVVQGVETTSFFGAPVTSPTTGLAAFTSTSTGISAVPTSTTIVTEFTTTTVAYLPFTTTAVNTQPTVVTTTFASPIVVTTTIVKPCCDE